MVAFLIALHVFVCIALILIVLLQPGNKQGMGAAMGGGGAQTVFGGRGANTFLSKLTVGLAAVFMLNSLVLVYVSSDTGSVTDKIATNSDKAEQTEETPPTTEQEPEQESQAADQATEETSPEAAAKPAGNDTASPEEEKSGSAPAGAETKAAAPAAAPAAADKAPAKAAEPGEPAAGPKKKTAESENGDGKTP